jgi:hypothetical protein
MPNIVTPKIFKTKNKLRAYGLSRKSITQKDKSRTEFNSMFKSRHYPPYITEWVNSVYYYNKSNVKLLPSFDVNVYNLIKSYFSFYIIKQNNIKTKGWRIREKKSTVERLIAGKPSMKHTNDKVNITIYTYDKSTPKYTDMISNIFTIDKLKNKYPAFFKNLKNKYISLESKLKHGLNNRHLKKHLRSVVINKYKPWFFKSTENYNKTLMQNKLNFVINRNDPLYLYNERLEVVLRDNLNNYIKKVMWDEIVSICYKQCVRFEQSKYEKQHIQLLTLLLESIYKKKVVLDIVNLKYFYNNSSIFNNAILTKLKIKKNKVIDVLSSALDTFNIPPLDRVKIYNEMYNKKTFIQNAFFKKIINRDLESYNLHSENFHDIIDMSLSLDSSNYSPINSTDGVALSEQYISDINLHKIMDSLKNKFTKGIRIETGGRLTKRNTADRSINKHDYKGNIRNPDSSMKGLPTVLLRGHAKSNLVYTQSKSRLRIGAFGLKTWVSSE